MTPILSTYNSRPGPVCRPARLPANPGTTHIIGRLDHTLAPPPVNKAPHRSGKLPTGPLPTPPETLPFPPMPCRRTTPRPHVPLSTAASPDSCLDTHPGQDLLPNPQDLDHVDSARALADAIHIDAGTLRANNPRLLEKSEQGRAERAAAGLPAYP